MLRKTRGIVITTMDYAEASVIAKIYTEEFGLQSFLLNGVRKQKSRFNKNLLHPLSTVELIGYYKPHKTLHRISELSASPQLSSIPYQTVKTALAIFLAEVLHRSIREEEKNTELFNFIHHSIELLDVKEEDCSRFHLCFMIQLTRYLGFHPKASYSSTSPYFDLQEGVYQHQPPMHPHYLEAHISEKFHELTKLSFEESHSLKINAAERKQLLHGLVAYYELHHTQGIRLRSYTVLEEVMG